jgi:uncharacterized Tic20 family protein
METNLTELPAPTPDERKFAMIAHVLMIFQSFIAPLVIFLAKRDSKFVRFHALQALFLQLFLIGLMICGFFVFFLFIMLAMGDMPKGSQDAPPAGFFVGMGLFYLVFFGQFILNVVLGVIFAVKANEGKWARYPLLGRLALHMVRG